MNIMLNGIKIWQTNLVILSFFGILSCGTQKCIPNLTYKVESINSGILLNNYLAYADAKLIFDTICQNAEKKANYLKEKNSMEYQSFLITNFSKQGRLYHINKRLSKPLIDSINCVLDTFSRTSGLDFMIDIKDTTIVYLDNKYSPIKKDPAVLKKLIFKFGLCDFNHYANVTDTIVKILNIKYQSDNYMLQHKYVIDSVIF